MIPCPWWIKFSRVPCCNESSVVVIIYVNASGCIYGAPVVDACSELSRRAVSSLLCYESPESKQEFTVRHILEMGKKMRLKESSYQDIASREQGDLKLLTEIYSRPCITGMVVPIPLLRNQRCRPLPEVLPGNCGIVDPWDIDTLIGTQD